MVIRKAYYAGQWYPYNKERLIQDLEKHFKNQQFGPGELPKSQNKEIRTIIGGVTPHAGYAYSGPCAAHTYLNLFKERIPDTVIILGTHHHHYTKIGIMVEGEWETPLGNLKIDNELAQNILEKSSIIIEDLSGFIDFQEHNIEIQLPFIKYCAGQEDVKIVPIKITNYINAKQMDSLANEIANVLSTVDKDVAIVASSDMSHYDIYDDSQFETLKKIDKTVIEQFLAFKPESILNPEKVVSKEDYNKFRSDERGPSICGRQTIATLVSTCKKLKATNSKLLKYYSSRDIAYGGGTWTVGYFSGILIKEN